jgi:ABC-type bacteriocin/lantibiotic exporter with double-glycine peptidase domain
VVRRCTGVTTETAGSLQRAPLRSLLPYLRDHRGVLVLAAVISLIATVLMLVQPLLVQRLIEDVGSGRTAANAVVLLVTVALAEAGFSSFQAFLLQRTAEGVVLGHGGAWSGTCCGCRLRSTTDAGSAT